MYLITITFGAQNYSSIPTPQIPLTLYCISLLHILIKPYTPLLLNPSNFYFSYVR